MHKSLKSSRKRMAGRLKRKHVKSTTRANRTRWRKYQIALSEANAAKETGLKEIS